MSMMSLLSQCRQAGIGLSYDGDSLRVQAPKGGISPELKIALQQHKPAIIKWLKESNEEPRDAEPQSCLHDEKNLYVPFGLSDLQRGFYLAEDPFMEFHVRPHYYIEKNVSSLDVERYQAAWNKALRRHRKELVIVRDDGDLQVIENPAPIQCQVIDLCDLPEEQRQNTLDRLRAEMMREQLPLDVWPWLDVRVSKWTEDGEPRYRIHYNHNNFFFDGGGTSRLLQEIDRYYRESDFEYPELQISVRDALLALEKMSVTEKGQEDRRYWESRVPDLPGPPQLPMRYGMNRRTRSKLHRREYQIGASHWNSFKEHARDNGLTPSGAVFAAYAEIIGAWSNTQHFVLSNMVTRRLNLHPDIWDILGNFASLYPLEVDLRIGTNFAERALRLQQQVFEDGQHLHWGGMQVMQALNQQHGGFGRAPIPFVIGSGLFMKGFERSDFSCLETCQVMLDHQFWELPDGTYYYVWDLLEEFFPPGMIDDMAKAYQELILSLSSESGYWKKQRFDLTPQRHLDERDAVKINTGCAPDVRLEDFIDANVDRFEDSFILDMPGQTLTYRELHERSLCIKDALKRQGLQHEQAVAVVCDRSNHLLIAVYGILRAGGAYVPVDPGLPLDRRFYLINNSGAKHVVVQNKYLGLEWPEDVSVLCVEKAVSSRVSRETSNLPGRLIRAKSEDLAYIIYTSGSTGKPKGVMIEHKAAANTILDVNERFTVSSSDRLFGVSSFGFDLSVYDLFGSAAAGAAIVFPEPENALNPSHWLDVMLQKNVTIWNSAPPLATLLFEAAEYRAVQLPRLRLVMLSGDWIALDLPEKIRRVAPRAKVVSLGGATEAAIWSIAYEVNQIQEQWRSIPYGYPMKNQRWHILDKWGRPAPEWTQGELYIAGTGLARGYRADADKTASSFITHPQTAERIYRTGDLGRYMPGGLIEFLGRQDNQVKIQGHRIELGEIESNLNAHESVKSSVVTVEKASAHTTAQLFAFVVPTENRRLEESELKRYLAQKLPDYMVPNIILSLDSLPISSNGKVDRKALQALKDQLEANTRESADPAPVHPPESEMERGLLEIWGKALKLEVPGVNVDFFSLGGQSFEAVQIVGMIREATKVTLSLGDIWEARTVRALAGRIQSVKSNERYRSLVKIDPNGQGSPLFMVHPAGGQVLCYREFGQCLSRPVYAFQAPGITPNTQPLNSIAAYTEKYINELNEVQPRGPVLLGGWSSGGLIAFDMAAQLREHNREVRGVVIIDSPAPFVNKEVPKDTMIDWFLTDLNLSEAFYNKFKQLNRSGLSEEEQLVQALKLMMTEEIAAGSDLVQMKLIFEVFKNTVNASRKYVRRYVDTDLLVVRAKDGSVPEFTEHPNSSEVTWGWKQLSSGRVTGQLTQGTHYSLLSSNNLRGVLEIIEKWLSQMRERSVSVCDKGVSMRKSVM